MLGTVQLATECALEKRTPRAANPSIQRYDPLLMQFNPLTQEGYHVLIRGEGGKININYLGTEYNLDGPFSFSEDLISLDNINIRDRFGNTGKLTGIVNHGGFRSMAIDLRGDFNRLQVLNTSAQDNSLFYGQGFGTGNITMKGPVNNLSIIANGRTERGTRIFIPIGGLEEVNTQEFINFTSFADVESEEKDIVDLHFLV